MLSITIINIFYYCRNYKLGVSGFFPKPIFMSNINRVSQVSTEMQCAVLCKSTVKIENQSVGIRT